MINPLVNIVIFQIGWFACVLGAAQGFPLVGPAVVLALLGLHLFLASSPAREIRLIVAAGILGSSLDTILMASGVYTFAGHSLSWLCPVWITALWLIFATTFNHSLSWLQGRAVLAAVLGAAGGPLSYYAGARLGAVALHPSPLLSLVVLAIVWALAMPGFMWLARVLARSPQPSRALAASLCLFALLPVTTATASRTVENDRASVARPDEPDSPSLQNLLRRNAQLAFVDRVEHFRPELVVHLDCGQLLVFVL